MSVLPKYRLEFVGHNQSTKQAKEVQNSVEWARLDSFPILAVAWLHLCVVACCHVRQVDVSCARQSGQSPDYMFVLWAEAAVCNQHRYVSVLLRGLHGQMAVWLAVCAHVAAVLWLRSPES